MKLTFLFKTLGSLGLIAALSVIVGPGIVTSVQAQTAAPNSPQTGVEASTTNLTIAEIVAQSGGQYDDNDQDFDILLNALKETDLVSALEADDADLTIFAPTDEAFLKFSRFFGYDGNDESAVLDIINREFTESNEYDVEMGGSDPNSFTLKEVVLYHFVPGIKTLANLQSLTGTDRSFQTLMNYDEMYPNAAFPIFYNNGSLDTTAPNIPVAKLQAGLTDISASNGIIHVVDRVLMPYYLGGKYPIAPTSKTQAGQPPTIADIITQDGEFDDNDQDFDILSKLIQTAELTDVFADPNANLTLFAPTDAAFIKFAQAGGAVGFDPDFLEDGVYNQILNLVYVANADGTGNSIDLLQKALKYHVSPGAKTATEIQAASSINTLLEGSAITPKDGKLVDLTPQIDDPQLLAGKTDIAASNGIIQGIDSVLIPLLFQAPAQ